ncbi:hypothetical protein MP228_001613 [Amoeboaphelidium protococcarum]|nr:hypothetical protein MP228_001613 [Amoeboaphelidium protococcarum]
MGTLSVPNGEMVAPGVSKADLKIMQRVMQEVQTTDNPQVPQKWKQPEFVRDNNCYRFASGLIAPAKIYNASTNFTCNSIIQAAINDGGVKVSKDQVGNYSDNIKCHYIAGVVTFDFGDQHWFRLMRPGEEGSTAEEWWHKPGTSPVMTVDYRGNKISKHGVESAYRANYVHFCGYIKRCQK